MKSIVCILACAAMLSFAAGAHAQMARPVQTFDTSAGPVKITPVYHASLEIEAGGKDHHRRSGQAGEFRRAPASRPDPDYGYPWRPPGSGPDQGRKQGRHRDHRPGRGRQDRDDRQGHRQWREDNLGRLDDRSHPHVQHDGVARPQARHACFTKKGAATATCSPTAASASTFRATPKAFPKCARSRTSMSLSSA